MRSRLQRRRNGYWRQSRRWWRSMVGIKVVGAVSAQHPPAATMTPSGTARRPRMEGCAAGLARRARMVSGMSYQAAEEIERKAGRGVSDLRKPHGQKPPEGADKTELLEQEGRGPELLLAKVAAGMRKWDSPKMAEEAAKPSQKSDEPPPEAPKIDPKTGEPLPLLLSAEQFVAGFSPPAYLVDGVLQRGYLYSLTARTGHGKTAVRMYVAQAIARDAAMHGREVKAGTVLLLAGENPDDIRARFLVLADAYGFKAEDLKCGSWPG